jgi:23S rRNA (uracil1939-C5)-methyltransferase
MIDLPYGEQLALKRGRVVQALARYPALGFLYTEGVLPAETRTAYRTRAKLIVAPGGHLGLFAKGGGHQVVDIPRCRVLAPVLARVAAHLRERILQAEASGGALAPFDAGGRGCLRAVDLRETRSESVRVLVTFVVDRSRVTDVEALRAAALELVEAVDDVAGVAVNYHVGDAPQVLGPETIHLAGVTAARDRVGASEHLATFGSFVQAHRGQALRVHTLLVAALGLWPGRLDRKPRVLDLYGGSGAIALGLAAAGAHVRLVESFGPSVAQARAAARELGLDVEAECSDVASSLHHAAERGEWFDAAVVNPPRRGTSPTARGRLAKLAPPIVAYVSCNPETLARDLDHFARLGYRAASLQPVDMIPLTEEVETVAILRRGEPDTPRVAYEDSEILVVEKGPHEPTMPQGEYTTSLLERTRRLQGAASAVPVHRLDVGTSGLVVLVRSPELVARWEHVVAAARKVFVAGVRGITPAKGAVTRELREDGALHPARSRYRRLAVASGQSLLRVVPEPGRLHQVRRHLAAVGYPVLGDERYGHPATNRYFEERNGLDRLFLHCVRIELDHPTTGAHLIVETPLPGDLRAVLERISGPQTLRFLEQKNALGSTSGGLGGSSLPPPRPGTADREAALDVDAGSPTMRPPELTDDDDDG